MDGKIQANLTMQQFREYLAFYEQNQLLKNQFSISEKVDFGILDTKIVFDYQNKLFCMSKNLDKTIFEGKNLKSFIIKEDDTPLFEGSAQGIKHYISRVPEKVMALSPLISQFHMNKQLAQQLDKMNNDNQQNAANNYFDVPEPFHSFYVELHMNHPYWTVIQCDMRGPTFSSSDPDVNDYMQAYNENIEEMKKLVFALKTIAFSNAPDQSIGIGMTATPMNNTAAAPSADPIEDIKKFKDLMDRGIITQQEFEAKKKQLLGI